MRKFLFDVILGIFIGIGACVVGIIALMDKVDKLKFRDYGFAEIVDNLVTSIKDLIHHLLYGYHHNRTYYKEWHSDINSRSCDTNNRSYDTSNRSYDTSKYYSSMRNWWNGKTKDDEELKAESEYQKEDEEASGE